MNETKKMFQDKGIFIVFEGIDGSGKDTHINLLSERLISLGYNVVVTFEPWISEAGKKLRSIAVNGRDGISSKEEADLYLEDRIEHIKNIVKPALKKGQIVLCSRYYYSTMAYQGALGADPDEIRKKNEREVPLPDIVIMLKVDVDEGLKRVFSRGKGFAKGYEREKYLEKVAQILYNIKTPYINTIESSASIEQTAEKIFSKVIPLLSKD
jgi:dTMP kinase